MKKVKEKSEKSGWKKLNDAILFVHLVLPLWLFALIYIPSISWIFLIPAVILPLSLGLISKRVKKHNKEKISLTIARILAVAAMVVYYVPFVLFVGFTENPALYTVKRFIYTHGVCGNQHAYYEKLLPEKLPDNCEDYCYRTKGSLIAQDYHPSSYLIFYTDAQTIEEYAAYYSSIGTRLDKSNDYDEGTDEYSEDGKFRQTLGWMSDQMSLINYTSGGLEDSVIYWVNDQYPKAVLLNSEKGLVAILT